VEELIAELMDVVQQEVRVCQQILESVEQEQDALVHHDIDPIRSAVQAQNQLTARAAALEKIRMGIVARLSGQLEEDPSALTLKRLIARVGGPEAERLRGMREALIDAHERIQRANRHNALLIRQSMKYVDRTLNILSGDDASVGVYAGSGKLETRKSSGQAVVNQVA
jgi:flagellar biosynthesis/type III secretory pathway chaperone